MSNHTRRLAWTTLIAAALLIPAVEADAKERRVSKPATLDITAAQLEDNDALRRILTTRAASRLQVARQPGKSR